MLTYLILDEDLLPAKGNSLRGSDSPLRSHSRRAGPGSIATDVVLMSHCRTADSVH